jgi:HPt (histidine-containing phosphotransfer) domain-containing protein
VAGIDSRAGVAAMMGDSTLYIHLLRMFRDRERNFAERFRAARARGDAATATRMAHDLKSVSGSLAVTEVNRAACVLERACFDGDTDERFETLLRDVERPLGSVIVELNAL